ncbi:hypothetical protein AXF42_Ash016986 [Apostasia shenzhenica]|uniref:Uncharacterized protein n=1 Tax=Apostasia shenzhenica TaxID=1088818 RepID=A0A2I0B7D8_9ASPA|nr:hypothetical protein AXF42_Ash016986 [Apostasia shenzhenica]
MRRQHLPPSSSILYSLYKWRYAAAGEGGDCSGIFHFQRAVRKGFFHLFRQTSKWLCIGAVGDVARGRGFTASPSPNHSIYLVTVNVRFQRCISATHVVSNIELDDSAFYQTSSTRIELRHITGLPKHQPRYLKPSSTSSATMFCSCVCRYQRAPAAADSAAIIASWSSAILFKLHHLSNLLAELGGWELPSTWGLPDISKYRTSGTLEEKYRSAGHRPSLILTGLGQHVHHRYDSHFRTHMNVRDPHECSRGLMLMCSSNATPQPYTWHLELYTLIL